MITDYVIVGASDVMSYISAGWKLYSNPFGLDEVEQGQYADCQYHMVRFYQAVIKESDD
jgi:hypothetical protein